MGAHIKCVGLAIVPPGGAPAGKGATPLRAALDSTRDLRRQTIIHTVTTVAAQIAQNVVCLHTDPTNPANPISRV